MYTHICARRSGSVFKRLRARDELNTGVWECKLHYMYTQKVTFEQ